MRLHVQVMKNPLRKRIQNIPISFKNPSAKINKKTTTNKHKTHSRKNKCREKLTALLNFVCKKSSLYLLRT